MEPDCDCRIELLGGLRLRLHAQTHARWETRKTAALLAYLALFPQRVHPRELLAELLWPEEEPKVSLQRLRQALYALRTLLEPQGTPPGSRLQTDRSHVQLNFERVGTDVAEFESLLQAGLQATEPAEAARLLEQALALYHGELLSGYYEDWMVPERERLGEAHRNVLSRLVKARAKLGDLPGALTVAQRAVQADPLRESSHYDLMRLLVANGRVAEALKQYQELERVLAAELGTAPSLPTRRLAEQLQAGLSSSEAPAAAPRPQESPITEMAPVPASLAPPAVPAAPSLPDGTVTFLLTDIEGSTRLWEQHPQAMRAALARHDALAATIIREHEGVVVKGRGEGDSLFCVFSQATQALTAALALQRAFQEETWPAETPIAARMALHTGEADLRDGDYYGPAVNRCARLRAIGHGGQVLVSAATHALLARNLPADTALQDRGLHRLKDLGEPEQVFQLAHPTLPADFPPLRSLSTHLNNLPYQLSSFIGREQEVRQVQILLSQTRLLTLTGAGGCGKTRLALQAAAEAQEAFEDGVWLVKLDSLSDPRLVVQAALNALGLREEPGRSLTETLTGYLQSRRLLLVLDNCEHLLAACEALAQEVLERCPAVQVLATSREALGLLGEQVYRVPSLRLPDASTGAGEPNAEAMLSYDAVRLFVERARYQRSDFALTAHNAAAVAQVCVRLEGIPLAIELAAARVRALSVEQIASRLDNRFHLLTGGSRTVLPRQQTLRAAIEWSYALLSAREQALLCRLSVFAGGWGLEAAEGVCGGEGIAGWEVLDVLTGLVDKSLVVYGEGGGAERYRMLEMVRGYGWERLETEGELERWRSRHLDWFLALAEEAERKLAGPEQGEWLERLEEEHDNLRAALGWCREAPEGAAVGQRLAGALWRFWEVRGYLGLGRSSLLEALERDGAGGFTSERGKALNGAGHLANRQSDYVSARVLYEESLAIRRELGDKSGIAHSLHGLGGVAFNQGDYVSAHALYEESLAIRRELGDKSGIAWSLTGLGTVATRLGDYVSAQALFEESLSLRRELRDKRGIAWSLSYLGDVATRQGDYVSAQALFEESLAIQRELGDKHGIAWSLSNLGDVAHAQGDDMSAHALHEESLSLRRELGDKSGIALSLHDLGDVAHAQGDDMSAHALHEESLAIYRELGGKYGMALSLHGLGNVAHAQGDDVSAHALFEESLTIRRELGEKYGIALSLEAFAEVASNQARPARAAHLMGAAETLREAIHAPISPSERDKYEHSVSEVRTALGEEAFAAAWSKGGAMTMEQAIAYALHDGPQESKGRPAK